MIFEPRGTIYINRGNQPKEMYSFNGISDFASFSQYTQVEIKYWINIEKYWITILQYWINPEMSTDSIIETILNKYRIIFIQYLINIAIQYLLNIVIKYWFNNIFNIVSIIECVDISGFIQYCNSIFFNIAIQYLFNIVSYFLINIVKYCTTILLNIVIQY